MQVGICYSLCHSKSSTELMLSVSKRDVKQKFFIFIFSTAISRNLIVLGLKGQRSEISIGRNFEQSKKGQNESIQNYPGTEMYTDRNVQSTIGHGRVPN